MADVEIKYSEHDDSHINDCTIEANAHESSAQKSHQQQLKVISRTVTNVALLAGQQTANEHVEFWDSIVHAHERYESKEIELDIFIGSIMLFRNGFGIYIDLFIHNRIYGSCFHLLDASLLSQLGCSSKHSDTTGAADVGSMSIGDIGLFLARFCDEYPYLIEKGIFHLDSPEIKKFHEIHRAAAQVSIYIRVL